MVSRFGLTRDVFPLLWRVLKTSILWATRCTIQSDMVSRFGLTRDVFPLLWSLQKTSRPFSAFFPWSPPYTRDGLCPSNTGVKRVVGEAQSFTGCRLLFFLFSVPMV